MRIIFKILPMATMIVLFLAGSPAMGDVGSQIYQRVTPEGGIQDLCLNTEIPVYLKKLDEGVYFVRVKNRYTGKIRASGYGEARDIACQKKTGLILFNRRD